jgi:hypothetical protein
MNGADSMTSAPLDKVDETLHHKLVDVVVVAVIKAVDVAQPSVPACPLAIAYTPLGEARHPNTIGIQTVAEVEILYLCPMLTCCHAINDVLVLTREGETIA